MEIITHSREETIAAGREFAKTLPGGALIAFTGGLGAGKTAFCQGLAEGLAAPTQFPARRSPSSTTTAARARWPTLIYTASTPRTTLPPPGSTTIWTWARWLPASGARTAPTCWSRSSPSISTSTGWTRRHVRLRLVDFIDFIT